MTLKVGDDKLEYIIKEREEQQRKEEIKEEDKKKGGPFILICLLSGLVGGVIGGLGMMLVIGLERSGLSFVDFWNNLQKNFTTPAAFIMIGLDALFILMSLLYYLKAKKIWNSYMDEDEKYEKADRKLSMSLLFSNVTYFINFAFFGFAMYASFSIAKEANGSAFPGILRIITTIIFAVVLFINLALQKVCINHTKIMNPEKKGSVYDMKFDKVWYESCDEAERMQIGIAGYKTVKATNSALIALMVIFSCAGMFFEIGILPVAVIAIIALVVNITYSVAAMNAGTGTSLSSVTK